MEIFNKLVEHLGEEDSLQLAELLTKVYTFFDTRVSQQTDASTQGDDKP
ncbi:TPA: hypothetical protein VJS51_001863 [Streptococcus pyogenes]|nr:hypothetical protein [Streptococcus pyogenes]